MRPARPILLTLPLAMSLGAGCSRAPHLEIEGPQARLSPSLVGVCALFMRIVNTGNGADALVGASLELPGAVAELHETRDGKMARRDRFEVPAHGALELRPGGPHIMVFNLPQESGAERELVIRLVFESSGERRLVVKTGRPE